MLLFGVVTSQGEGFEYVEGVLVSKCFSLNMKVKVAGLYDIY